VASERQIAANRRNALKSTGPKSDQGKKRAARNSTRHGLNNTSSGADNEEVESRARQIGAGFFEGSILEQVRTAARAQLRLERIQELKAEVVDRISEFDAVKLRPRPKPITAGIRDNRVQQFNQRSDWRRVDLLYPIDPDDRDRINQQLRRSLPELKRLDRYERRAISERERAMKEIFEIYGESFRSGNLRCWFVLNPVKPPRTQQAGTFAPDQA
jgi:hypothetical protein